MSTYIYMNVNKINTDENGQPSGYVPASRA